jgi:hypothetical protein
MGRECDRSVSVDANARYFARQPRRFTHSNLPSGRSDYTILLSYEPLSHCPQLSDRRSDGQQLFSDRLLGALGQLEGLGKVLAVAAEMVEEERSLLGTGEATSSHDAGYRRLAVQPARG